MHAIFAVLICVLEQNLAGHTKPLPRPKTLIFHPLPAMLVQLNHEAILVYLMTLSVPQIM
jgi:hypothetical protein